MYGRCYAIDEYSMTVSEQRLDKLVSAEKSTHTILDLMLGTGCFLCGPCRGFVKKRELEQAVQLSSAKEAEKRWRYSSVDSRKGFCTAAVKIETERGKLKNLHCKKPLPRNG
jgi:hypothetical protein